MKLYRAFTVATFQPYKDECKRNCNKSYKIYIPEHITYNSEQEALSSNTRWDYSFGVNDNDVVIMVRHITVIDNNYVEIREMPEYCYDFDTFIALGGWIECIIREENVVDINRIHDDFNHMFPQLLTDQTMDQIHLDETDLQVLESENVGNIRVPCPVSYISRHNLASAGNNNCNRPLVCGAFFEALNNFEKDLLEGKSCSITEDYVSTLSSDANDPEDFIYDARMKKVVNEAQWMKECYNFTVKKKQEQKRALEKHGILDAYNSLETYLQNHHSIRQIHCDFSKEYNSPYKIIERSLIYGYKLSGFTIFKKKVIWEITVYERAIKENDCIRGMDVCFLKYCNGVTKEAVRRTDYMLMNGKELSGIENSEDYITL